jgi:hypothetical protein
MNMSIIDGALTLLPVTDLSRCEICGRTDVPTQRTYDPDPRVPQVVCIDAESCAAEFDEPDAKPRRARSRRGLVENDEYAAFVRRIIRAYAKRVATGDVEALADMVALSSVLDDAITDAVAGLRGHGYSWADIAARLGITRQAAQQRWGADT